MSAFTKLARGPYYISVVVFMAFAAVASWILHTATADAHLSDLYGIVTLVQACLAGWALFFLFTHSSGEDDEADTEIGGVKIGKKFFYFGVLAVCAYRAYVGYTHTHSVGIESIYGDIWVASSVALAFYTWANYVSYKAKHPPVVQRVPGGTI